MRAKGKAQVAALLIAGLLPVTSLAANTRLELGACTTYRYLGRSVCFHKPTRTRTPYYSRVHTIRKVLKFVPKTSIRKPVVRRGQKMNKREILRLYHLQR